MRVAENTAVTDRGFDRVRRGVSSIGLAVFLVVSIGVGSLGLTGCGKAQHSISQYLGKNEEQIKAVLGEPGEIEDERAKLARAFAVTKPTLYYPFDTFTDKKLPRPLRELEFHFSEAGLCHQISGRTYDYDAPEELLEAIGLGSLQREITDRDQLGFDYKVGDFSFAQVHRSSSHTQRYSSFNLYHYEAGLPNP